MAALLKMLDPDVVLRADAAAVQASASRPDAPALAPVMRGAAAVAEIFKGRAQVARLALIDDAVGAVFAPGGLYETLGLFNGYRVRRGPPKALPA